MKNKMISIHAKINKNNEIIIPFEEWQEILPILSGVNIEIEKEKPDIKKLEQLLGLGKEIWQDIAPVQYQKKEREN